MNTVVARSLAATASRAGTLSAPHAQRLAIVRHLIATMMMGHVHGLSEQAARIHSVVAKMLGDGRPLRITMAFAAALGGNVGPANELLAEGMDDWPDAQRARISLALALKVGGDPRWAGIVDHALAASNDMVTRRFARQVRDMARTGS